MCVVWAGRHKRYTSFLQASSITSIEMCDEWPSSIMSTDSTDGMFSKKKKSFSEREGTRNSTFFHFVRHLLVGIYHHWWENITCSWGTQRTLCVFPSSADITYHTLSDYLSRLQWICLSCLDNASVVSLGQEKACRVWSDSLGWRAIKPSNHALSDTPFWNGWLHQTSWQ